MAIDHANARCSACVWAREKPVAVSDGFQHSSEVRHFSGLFCHVARPPLQVDRDGFCPDFQAAEAKVAPPWQAQEEHRGRRGGRPANSRSDD